MRHLWGFWFGAMISLALAVEAKPVTVRGVVVDSACAYIKDVKAKVDPECAAACARAGSPLIILADDGKLYLPIAEVMPATSQNPALLEFAGKRVVATGKVYERGGSRAIVLSKVEAEPAAK